MDAPHSRGRVFRAALVAVVPGALIGWTVYRRVVPAVGELTDSAPGADAAPDILVARIGELERALAARDREISRLETGAVRAWDATVPGLEARIEALQAENVGLADALDHARDELESQSNEVEHLRRAVTLRDRRRADEGKESR
ncbi:hypothetical protein [Acidipropionibacterium virtanenii]|uniref:Chromosome partition protein Smc n=1 Tax=Acidipropionibacterium virtanenii TaxID=2057246 RepID=A0A344UQE6_9ACTN|nr:hypothetical protein [Acidipropionibacterium virtanenii]AXE37494.1 hypothetical protein JS278_00297 [Acidipropionibacterium virtanenii]